MGHSDGALAPVGFTARPGVSAAMLFVLLLVVYHINGDFLVGNDAKSNVYLAPTLLSKGRLTFTPQETPFMFHWKLSTPEGDVGVSFDHWDAQELATRTAPIVLPTRGALRELYDEGRLTVQAEKYYVVPTTTPGHYVTTFGPGSGLSALPVYGLLETVVDGDLINSPRALWYGGKFAAAACVAGSAVFVFFTVLPFLDVRRAWTVALAYGLGTSVWSISSQTLWAHGPNELFLAMGAFFLSRLDRRRHAAWLSGLAFAAAVACRAPSAVLLLAAGIWLLTRPALAIIRRQPARDLGRPALEFALGALPLLALLALHNWSYLGAPWHFGHTNIHARLVELKTGNGNGGLWQTPVWVGAAGLLFSPSRGLLIHSPFLVFALWGSVEAWQDDRFRFLRPLSLATLGLWLIAFTWYDWWGGWCFSYRPLVDTMPMLALLLAPVIETITTRAPLRSVFYSLLVWSVAVQWIGAFAYNVKEWNSPLVAYELLVPGETKPVVTHSLLEVQELVETGRATLARTFEVDRDRHGDIDWPENHHRLWSISDSELAYYALNFQQCRLRKKEGIQLFLENP